MAASLCSPPPSSSSFNSHTPKSLTTTQRPTTTMPFTCRRSSPRPISAMYAAATGSPTEKRGSGSSSRLLQSAPNTLYDLLGVQAGASCQEIKKAYRQLARELHPDVVAGGKSSNSDDDFIRVHEAYSTLSDPQRRADYDRAMFLRRSLAVNERFAAAAGSGSRGTTTTTTIKVSGYPRRWETDQCW